MTKPRGRDLGIPFEGATETYIAIIAISGGTFVYSVTSIHLAKRPCN
jgi:hypothetical protein